MFVKESDYSFCSVVGRTDVGCKRSVNEDSIGRADTPNGLAVVICDGMGGNVGGKTASETAVGAILQHLREHLYNNPQEAVSNAIQEANKAVLKKVSLRPELTGMGCTCVLLLISKSGTVNIGHVGDSRIYLIRDGMANHLTKDQSYVQMLVDEGRLTPQEAEHHPRNNEITNAVGMMNMTPPVIRERAINPVAGDCFLLCSDGLSKLVPEEDIVKIVSARSYSTERRAEMLIDAAKNNGGSDNISVQLVEFSVSPAEVKLSKDRRRMIIFTSSVVLAAVLALCGFFILKGGRNDSPKVPVNGASVSDTTDENKDISSIGVSETPIIIPDYDKSATSGDQIEAASNSVQNTTNNEESQGSSGEDSVDNADNQENDQGENLPEPPNIRHFPKDDQKYHVEKPTGRKVQFDKDAKITKDCCEFEKGFTSSQIHIEGDGKGGIYICKNTTSDDVVWESLSITIKHYYNNKGEKKPLIPNIVIKFD